ncbi:ATP-dependent helicase HrpB [Porphyrobacter sp. AAP60]|uniref:ATP-dependent helicase HrpB n=1 Tax=Porphyrobacter sp. AAP60 TaxID=1523423 RepID=UPI0006B9B501|nr:ATP-dependent helicase HrpB [Porphyrobacter sp. AAP60]KPF64912.1 ATP-dependent helicase [Porphyrobacter sp. AAP60]
MLPVLPIHAVLPEISSALADRGAGVLIAPPGAGKTTAVAPDLLGQPWCTGQIILTSPRRVAARAAAERMAEMLGERPGETVGYMTRLDSKTSARTRIIVVTDAILVNRLIDDPELPGVSALLFDEAHERGLDSDLGLALALETRAVLREDLRVLVMSATIDGTRFARLLGDGAQVIESEGKSFPLAIKWLGGDASQVIEDRMAAAVLAAWREEAGDILAFLPGVREIKRVRERLELRLKDVPIHSLHGQIEPSAQRAAIRSDPQGRRRIVLATAIAETSLTLDGVSVVVDSGLARLAEYDRAAGTTHLVTRRASQASAAQRAGRAARQGPGVAYRLWEEAGHAGRPEFAPPEIMTADLATLLLRLARWGASDPGDLPWLDPPPEASVAAARAALEALGALDLSGRITPLGEAIASLPMAPDQAAAVLHGAKAGCGEDAARLVMLLQERGLGGRGEDLLQRLARWRGDHAPRSVAAARIAKGWAKQADKLAAVIGTSPAADAAEVLGLARPDFVARRRDPSGEYWLSAGGRGYQLDPASPLARAEWIVIGDAQGLAKGARITAGAEIASDRIAALFACALQERITTRWNYEKARVEARRERRLGAIVLASVPEPAPDPALCLDILVTKALERLDEVLPAGFLPRARFAGIDALSEDSLRQRTGDWLGPLLAGRRDLDLPQHRFAEAALGLLDWSERQALDRAAPTHFISPADTRHAIDYAGDDAPSVEVRVQGLFGLDSQPMIGRTPLLLKLTSPGGRPVQSTRDLPGFWRGSWRDVVKDMKGRYPKHRWPDQPWLEKPSMKTKNAFNRE